MPVHTRHITSQTLSSHFRLKHSIRPVVVPRGTIAKPSRSYDWNDHKHQYESLANFNIISFNLLAPCYKRLTSINLETGSRDREDRFPRIWKDRARATIDFLRTAVFPMTSIVAFQEYWLDEEYTSLFNQLFKEHGYDLRSLQRTGKKMDAVAIAIKSDIFTVLAVENISLCSINDRVALLVWLRHNYTGKDVLVANTHLSFPHNACDQISQMRQMRKLTGVIDQFAKKHQIDYATRIVLGDFNVQGESPVCDHLREEGYYSCFEVSPPQNVHNSSRQSILRYESTKMLPSIRRPDSVRVLTSTIHSSCQDDDCCMNDMKMSELYCASRYPVKFVSHRTHRAEDLGVDHIFVKPEFEYTRDSILNADASNSSAVDSNTHFIRTGGVFVDGTEVIPNSLPSSTWNTSFHISDHRPVGACLVIGRDQRTL